MNGFTHRQQKRMRDESDEDETEERVSKEARVSEDA